MRAPKAATDLFEGSAINLPVIDVDERAGKLVGNLKARIDPRTSADSEVNRVVQASLVDRECKALHMIVAASLLHDGLD